MKRPSISTRRTRSQSARFDEKVDRYSTPDGCWPWHGATDGDGYGLIATRAGRLEKTHRFAYEREYGPIPKGMVIMHLCDNPRCCRPAHLRIATQAENIQNAAGKGRLRPGGRPCRPFTAGIALKLKAGTPEYRRLYGRLYRADQQRKRRRIAASLEISIEEKEDEE